MKPYESVMEFEIVPHVGIGPVKLGMSRSEVAEAVTGLRGALPGRLKGERTICYFSAALQIEFGEISGRAQFIGMSNAESILCRYKGKDVFDLAAPELFALISSGEAAGPHVYNAIEYYFPEQVVTLWEADKQYDRKGDHSRPVYAQIGVGNSEYRTFREGLRARREARLKARGDRLRIANPLG